MSDHKLEEESKIGPAAEEVNGDAPIADDQQDYNIGNLNGTPQNDGLEENAHIASETDDVLENGLTSSTDEAVQQPGEGEAEPGGRAEAILEGLLFLVGDEGITAAQAAAALEIDEAQAMQLFDSLQKRYLSDDHGIEIANYGGIFRFLSKGVVHDYARRLFQLSKTDTLSQAALETLAIIAYKQPVTRVEIEEIRGVGSDVMLRKLMARDLIRETGRSDAPGRPILYEVTEEFMNSFKLLSLNELPDLPKFEDDEENGDLFNK